MEFKKQVAIVTGSSRGIGKATALLFLEAGANVVILARDQNELMKCAEEFQNDFGNERILAIVSDVSRINDINKVVSETIRKFGRLDILVNNAGVAVYKKVLEMSEKEWNQTLDVNLKAVFLFSKAVLPQMTAQNYGRIISISSGLGKSGYPALAAYSASKFGVIGFTESLAYELAETKIKVFAVLPGGVNTKMHRDIFPEEGPNLLLKPERIARVILALASTRPMKPSGSSIEVYS